MRTLLLSDFQKSKGNSVFDESCTLSISDKAALAIESGRLNLTIRQVGRKKSLYNLKVVVRSHFGNIKLAFGDSDSSVEFGDSTTGAYDVVAWRRSSIKIGAGTSSNGTRIICDDSSFITGEDCMFSSNVLIQTCDQHGVVDLKTGEIINARHRKVILGDHVWLGRQATIMPDVVIGEGSIVGACATATRSIPKTSVAVGIPAQVVKEDTTWCRSPHHLDTYAQAYVQQFSATGLK